jgi:FHS family L-fucose permease-like MFS transporter
MACGVVFLQVAANPYVTALGPSDTASGRLNLTQALNSIATTLAPIIASVFVFKVAAEGALDSALTPAQAAASVPVPFVIIGILVLIIAVVIFLLKLPVISTTGEQKKSVWKHPHVILGAIGIFFYVGAEVGSAAMIQRYVQEANPAITIQEAAKMIALYWGGAMIGRFYASFMLSNVEKRKKNLYTIAVLILAFVVGYYVRGKDVTGGLIFVGIAFVNYLAMLLGSGKANKTLAVFAGVAAILALATMLVPVNLILWVGCSIGFFNSVMFPNIFALGVDGLDKGELSTASGIINTLIVGGAVIPVLMGAVADGFGVKFAFILPIICYAYIAFFALVGSKMR